MLKHRSILPALLDMKSLFGRYVYLFVFIFLAFGNSWGQTSTTLETNVTMVTFTSSGTWTVPAGTTGMNIYCIGGGGGGGGVSAGNNYSAGGGGGGACAVTYNYRTFTAGTTSLTITVGAGGNGGSAGANSGSNGFASSVLNGATTVCLGDYGRFGSKGNSASANAGGSGGLSSNCTGTVSYNGGNGGTSSNTGGGSGGGGGAASYSMIGTAGGPGSSYTAGGRGGIGTYFSGGNGGLGSNSIYGADGTAGSTYGGGGGGAFSGNSSGGTYNQKGGNGAAGVVVIIYTTTVTKEYLLTSGTWTPPSGVTAVDVECWGGGGGGASASASALGSTGGGGGGGAYKKTTSVSVSGSVSYTIGAPGTTGAGGSSGNAGGVTTFSSSTPVSANGGNGGSYSSSNGAGGAGGTAGTAPAYAGGAGAAGSNSSAYGGGGGASGGISAVGNNGSTSSGGSASVTSGSGRGGTGATNNCNSPPPQMGSLPGGGGGGGYYYGVGCASNTGSSGGSGLIILTYTPLACSSPVISTQPSNLNECVNAGNTISVAATGTSLTYQWFSNTTNSYSGGTNLGSGNGAQTATYTPPSSLGGTYYYYCVITSAGSCNTNSGVSTVTVMSLPSTSNAGLAQSLCLGGNITLAANSPSVGTGAWSITSGPNTSISQISNTAINNATFTPTAIGTYQLTWTISNSPCSASSNTVTITCNGVPTTATVSSTPLSVCGSLTSGSLGGNTPTTGTGAWSYVSGVTGTFSNVASPNSTFTASGYGTSVLRWTISNSPCTASYADVTVYFSPNIGWANVQSPSTGSICSNGTFDVYGQVFIPTVTEAAGQGTGVTAQLGWSTSNTNPSTWTNWIPANFNVQVGNNDEFKATLSGLSGTTTYYYAFKYSLNGCTAYGGYSAANASSNIWTINTNSGGVFIGNSNNNGGGSSGINSSNSQAFGLYNSSGGTTEAIRNFPALLAGQTIQFDLDNGYVNSSGPTVGVSLQNASGNNVWDFYFSGGASSYAINAGSVSPSVSIPYTANGLRVILTLTSSTTYSATIQTLNGGSSYGPFTGNLLNPTGGQGITRFRAFNYNAGSGANYDFYVNNIVTPSFYDNAYGYSSISNNAQSPTSVGGIWNGSTIVNGTLSVTASPTTANAGSTQTICEGSTATLAANTPSTGTGVWSISSGPNTNSNQLSSTSIINPVFTPTAAGTYTLFWTISNGSCTSSSSVTITVTSGILNFVNLQSPTTATICNGGSQTIYGQVYEPGVTDTWYSQGAGITVEFGYNSANTNPNTWTTWSAATYNTTSYGDNDEYSGTISGLATGTYYYAFRYKLNCGAWQYGGTSGTWSSNSGVLTINDCFGTYASAPYLTSCNTTVSNQGHFYNTTGTGVDMINSSGTNYNSYNFGTYYTNSAGLILKGAEVKTWNGSGANVCSAKMYYRVYSGSPSGAFTVINLNYYDGCSGGAFPTGGPCNTNDQKWRDISQTIDLTTLSAGTYSLEVYYEITGNHLATSGCGTTQYLNNNGSNYIANFTLVTATIASNTGAYCTGSTIQLNSSAGGTSSYSWSGPNSFSSSAQNPSITTATTSMAGTYTVTASLGTGCTQTASTNVVVNAPTVPTFNPIAAICKGGVLSALPTTSTNGITGTWSPTLNNSSTTIYTFTPSSGTCVGTGTITISVNAPPEINAISPP